MKSLNLSGDWTLKSKCIRGAGDRNVEVPVKMPGDIHSALIEAGVIEDPYYGTRELDTLWVGKSDWSVSRTFLWKRREGRAVLRLSKVDTVCTLVVNGHQVARMDNEHRIYHHDLTDVLVDGENTIEFLFFSAEQLAAKRNSELEYPVPHSRYPNDSPYRNLVRKAQCNAGWDWGPCLMTFGVYDPIIIKTSDELYVRSSSVSSLKEDSVWFVTVEAEVDVFKAGRYPLIAGCELGRWERDLFLQEGRNTVKQRFEVKSPVELWWPNGCGEQKLYLLNLSLGEWEKSCPVAFRTLSVAHKAEGEKREFTVMVNGKRVFAKGANWIPLDALYGKITQERYERMLRSVADANMNMIRLWGGGYFESDLFYRLCDEKGIMVWHDMMFACSTYPAEEEFLASVELEVRDQIRRLKGHPCIALWCGNNEDLGAIGWYEESRQNPTRYVVDYDRLNHGVLERVIGEEDSSHLFWPSSPCAGPNDFSDNWHSDGKGDMHYWAVWHEGREFEAYHQVKPRFCSEFGYQSFPSYSEALTFTPADQLNLTSEVFEHHQKNPRGNSIIIENFTRYFRFPTSFEHMLYLSQVQQALAIETAVVYWLSLMPYCMGTLYWQLNDVWPCSSWSSIEYSGKWKPLHYHASHLYENLSPLLYLDDGKLELSVANSNIERAGGEVSLVFRDFEGVAREQKKFVFDTPSMTSEKLCSLPLEDLDRENLYAEATLLFNGKSVQRTLFLTFPKRAGMRDPSLSWSLEKVSDNEASLVVESRNPAFCVVADPGSEAGRFDDNFITVNGKKTLRFVSPQRLDIASLKKQLKVYDLWAATR